MVFFNRCCCRSVENQVDGRSGRQAPSQRGESKSNTISGGDNKDDDSDIQAVQWMRNRSKRSSKAVEDDVVDMWIEKQEQASESPEQTKQEHLKENTASPERNEGPSSAIRSSQLESSPTRTPMDTDGIKDMEVIADDSSHVEMKMDSQVITDPTHDDNVGDADSASARYVRADNLLHKTTLEKDVSLMNTKRDFLTHLFGSFEEKERDNHVSAIENAARALEKDTLFDASTAPSPSQTLQNITPPRQPTFRGVRVSVVSSLNRSSSAQAFELTIRGSSSIDEDSIDVDMDERDAPPVLITEDLSPVITQKDGDSYHIQSFPSHNNWDDDDDDATLPFYILGQSSDDRPHVLTPLVLEALRGFLPFVVSEENFWLKFSLLRDGASLATLLHMVRASKWTIIGVETMEGDVFGSFTATPWRKQKGFYGSGEAFLWRLKRSRSASTKVSGTSNKHEMEIYPYTGFDDSIQHCSDSFLMVGGGDWIEQECPYIGEPKGIGLMVDRDLVMGATNSCATFANPRLCRRTKTSNDFHISNMEVWTMTPCTNLEEAQKLEGHKLFVEEHQCVVSVQ